MLHRNPSQKTPEFHRDEGDGGDFKRFFFFFIPFIPFIPVDFFFERTNYKGCAEGSDATCS
jgi:hypothetical protein